MVDPVKAGLEKGLSLLGWAGSPKVLRVRKNIGLSLNLNFFLGFKPITNKAKAPDSSGLWPISVNSDLRFLVWV
jgi:hypothetical protein